MSRKHFQQMNPMERAFIHGYLRSDKRAFISDVAHFTDRATERHFTFQEAVQAIKTGKVVEVHDDKNPCVRALVRDSKGTCVVVDLTTNEIITVYYNDPADQHDTLNWNLYRWNQDIVQLVKSL